MQIDLNGFRTRLVIYLQQNYVRRNSQHTRNSLFSTTNAAHYKYKVFPYDEFLHATIIDAAQYTTFIPIKPNNTINIKCDFGFCDKFNKYTIPDEELYYGTNAP